MHGSKAYVIRVVDVPFICEILPPKTQLIAFPGVADVCVQQAVSFLPNGIIDNKILLSDEFAVNAQLQFLLVINLQWNHILGTKKSGPFGSIYRSVSL